LFPQTEIDALGWPVQMSELRLGARCLRRVLLQGGRHQALVLSEAGRDLLLFGEPGAECAELACLCAPALDAGAQLVRRLNSASAPKPCSEHLLPGAQLQDFLQAHPDALVIDVREPYEQFLSHTPPLWGATLQAVPLSRLLNALPAWLTQPEQPLLFFCRSGNRSRQAAAALASLGHSQAWSLNGGLALLPAFATEDPALMV